MPSQSNLLAIVGDIDDNKDNLRRLVAQLKTPIGIIPFVGAGLSIPFGFPAWSSFLTTQAKKAGISNKIRQHLKSGEYEEAAEDLQTARGYRAFHDAISNTFGVHKVAGMELKGAVYALPTLARGPVITTNFDHVLEEAFKQAGKPFAQEVWGIKADLAISALQQNLRFLLKIHGDAEDSTDRILTKSDYQKQYGTVEDSNIDFSLPLPRLLNQILLGRPLLFLGCSLNKDRTIDVLERVAHDFRSIAHYAVIERPKSAEQFYERSRFLSDHNIRPIWYPHGRHDLIESLLNELARIIPLSGEEKGIDHERRQSLRVLLPSVRLVVGDQAWRTAEAIRQRYDRPGKIGGNGCWALVGGCREIYDILDSACPYKNESEGSVFKPPHPNHIANTFPSPPYHRGMLGQLGLTIHALARISDANQALELAQKEVDDLVNNASRTLTIYPDYNIASAIAKVQERFVMLRHASASTSASLPQTFATEIIKRLNKQLKAVPDTVTSIITGPIWEESDLLNEVTIAIWHILTDLAAAVRFGQALIELLQVLDQAIEGGTVPEIRA